MNWRGSTIRLLAAAAVVGACTAGAAAQDDKVFKLGVVAFLSGPAAESFGKPAWDGARTVIEALNAGGVIKPYDQVGFGGLKIEVVLIDEAGGATKQVEELRNAFERDHVDAVLGYISSGDCLAVAPAAEALKKMLVLMDCGTPRIFEENKFKYVFRSAAHGGMDNVAMARYLTKEGLRSPISAPSTRTMPGARIPGATLKAAWRNSSRQRRRRSSSGRNWAPANTAPRFQRCCRKSRAWSIRAYGAATSKRSCCKRLRAAC